jgi:hypothetical protein
LILLIAMAIAVALSGCGQATATDQPSPTDQPIATESASATTAETPPGEPSPGGPTTSAEPQTASPTTSSAEPSDGSPSGPGSASSCTGSDENRDFFASMAAAVDWTVYCPSLPDGWFVNDGQYRLANGGWMEITYDGPGDAVLDLRQGALGDAAGGCSPPGSEVGEAAFGDQAGLLIQATSGGWATVVDRGESICWMVFLTGVGETEARQISADLRSVAG